MKKLIIIMLVLLFAVGCTSYHKVTNLNTGEIYYTTEVEYKGSGAVQFEDRKTNSVIVLPCSKVQDINKEQYNYGLYSEPAPSPTDTNDTK